LFGAEGESNAEKLCRPALARSRREDETLRIEHILSKSGVNILSEFEQIILQLAAICNDLNEFNFKLEMLLVQTNDKGFQLLQAGNALFERSYFVLALCCWNKALTHFVKINDRSGESACYGNLGIAYRNLGDVKRAIECQEKSLKIAEEMEDRAGEATCYTNLGNAYHDLGDFRKAIRYHEKALKTAKEIKNRYVEAKCYTNLGIAYHDLGDFRKAIRYHEKALKTAKEMEDRAGEATCYTNLGNAYHDLGDFRKAIRYHEKALKTAKEIKNRSIEASCYTGLGTAYVSLGDFARAIEYFEKSLKTAKEIKDREREASSYNNLGIAYRNLGDFARAIEYFKDSLKMAKEIDNRPGEVRCTASLGAGYLSMGDFGQAIKYFTESLKIAEKIEDKAGEANAYGNLGVAYYNERDFARAVECFEKSLTIAKEIEDKTAEANAYGNLGIAYYNERDFARAVECFEKSLTISREIGEIENERSANFNLALLFSESNPELSYDYCRRSIQLSEIVGAKLVQENYAMGFRAQASKAYQLMVPLSLKLFKEKEALEYVEASKSRAFLELLAANPIKPTAKLTSELNALLKEEEDYLLRWREIQTSHLKQPHSQVEPGETGRILQKLNSIYDEIGKFDPEYVSARRAKPLSLNEIQVMLSSQNKNAVLLEYFVTDKETFIFIVSSENKELYVKTVSLSVERLLRYMEDYWREVVNNAGYGDIGSSWLGLSEYLLEPVSELLTGNYLVYFVPHGLLHYLPLHALELNGEPLIKRHPVVYSPSASALKFCLGKGTGKLDEIVSFGADFEAEASAVAELFRRESPGKNVYKGKAATKENVYTNSDNDIIHFSCHGYFNADDPLSSGIKLYDGILTAREIFSMKLNTELVTLSACQTGINKTNKADELIGLTRALLYAGAPSVAVSLWSVDAKSTQELMVEFYKQLKSGTDKATALQEAQKKIMEKHPHPYYWAPFILVGKPS
jgi:tetratricopeptide (TPR) repeat protein